MRDWGNLIADEDRIIGKHYTPGRGGNKIQYVIIHHNAGVLSIADCYQTWQTRQASAHYQVEVSGRIGQLVRDRDTSWNAGNFAANQRSIAIEHANSGGANAGWPISEATREAGAHLVAALCRYYGLGRPQWKVNVFPHQHFSSTACPGQLATTYRDAYMARAQEWYDQMTGAKAPTVTVVPAAPAPAAKAAALAVDGVWGPATTSALQRVLGTTADGVVSSQDQARKVNVPAAGGGWEWVTSPSGSQMVAALQRKIGTGADGIIGPGTVSALQRRLGVDADGYAGPLTVRALQARLNGSGL